MLCRQIDRNAWNQLERADAIATRVAQQREQGNCRLNVFDCDQRRRGSPYLRKQLEAGGRNDPQRALGAQENRLDVVAGVVFAQRTEAGEHPAVGENHFQPQDQVAHHAVPKYARTACIGRQVTADLTAAFGPETQRKKTFCIVCSRAHVGQHAPGFGNQRVVERIHAAHAVHPLERQHDLCAGFIGRGATAVAGVAPVRNDADTALVADSQET